MADIAIITGATGGIGMEFVKAIHPSEDIDDFCKINCRVPSMLISIALPYMRAGARILNIASASSFQPNPYLSMYSASKVFLKNLSRALSVELKPRGIAVTAVCPGWVDTGMLPREKTEDRLDTSGW